MDVARWPDIKDDLDFVEKLISEQSVFCLPAKVSTTLLQKKGLILASAINENF